VCKCSLSPNDESSELSTWCKLLEIKSGHIDNFDSWDVSECFDQFGIFIKIDDERSFSNSVSLVSQFTFTGSECS